MTKNETCKFDPESYQHREGYGEFVKCPCCSHMILLGFPHPDFTTADLPIPEDVLTKMSEASPIGIGGCMGDGYED